MSRSFLDTVDTILSSGLASISTDFKKKQVRFIIKHQCEDGGFPGRRGGSDTYYTEFALRLLALLDPENPAVGKAALYIENIKDDPQNVVQCFSLLNAYRILRQYNINISLDLDSIRNVLTKQNYSNSAYDTFLAALCFEIVDNDFPDVDKIVSAVQNLRQPDGGYSESIGQNNSQTNSTSAALAFLRMHNLLSSEHLESACSFLASMQSKDGGLLSQDAAPQSDLLSTFTGLLSLSMLDNPDRLDIKALAHFLKCVAVADGGFLACPEDDAADIEYTYYGVGIVALLRAYTDLMRSTSL